MIQLDEKMSNHSITLSTTTSDSLATSTSEAFSDESFEAEYPVLHQICIILLAIFLILLIVTSIVGNILVCVAVATEYNLRKLSNLFLVSLAIADLLVAALGKL